MRFGSVVAKGSLIMGVVGLIENGGQFLKAIVLARIIDPSDFGLMGMAFVVAQACEALSQTGFYTALVQKQTGAEEYLDTVWTVSILRSIALFALLWALAPFAALFFSTPAAAPVVRGVAVGFLLQGLVNPAVVLLERDLAFVRYEIPFLTGFVVDIVASILLTAVLRNVWGMVWGLALGRAVATIASFIVLPRVPRLRIRKAQVVELYKYGRHISRAAAADYVVSQLDRALVGRMLGPAALGLYAFAARLASLPSAGAYKVVFGVAFPVFSKIQTDASRVRSGFLKALGSMGALAAPVGAGLFAVSADLVIVLFGQKWAGMIPAFRILCAGGACMGLYQLVGAIVRGIGRPDLAARATGVLLAVIAAFLYPGIRMWGILGAAGCMTFGAAIAMLYLLAAGSTAAGCGRIDVVRVLAPSVVASVLMAMAVVAARAWLAVPPGWGVFIAESLCGAVLYVGLALPLDRWLGSGIVDSVRSLRRT
jgi:O-antigen/teichoic acid export membrane protein